MIHKSPACDCNEMLVTAWLERPLRFFRAYLRQQQTCRQTWIDISLSMKRKSD